MKRLAKKKMIFGYREGALTKMRDANIDKLVELIHIIGILLRIKTYLFYRRDDR